MSYSAFEGCVLFFILAVSLLGVQSFLNRRVLPGTAISVEQRKAGVGRLTWGKSYRESPQAVGVLAFRNFLISILFMGINICQPKERPIGIVLKSVSHVCVCDELATAHPSSWPRSGTAELQSPLFPPSDTSGMPLCSATNSFSLPLVPVGLGRLTLLVLKSELCRSELGVVGLSSRGELQSLGTLQSVENIERQAICSVLSVILGQLLKHFCFHILLFGVIGAFYFLWRLISSFLFCDLV